MENFTLHQTEESVAKGASRLPYPTISIVTPSYNQGQFIEDTINSVLSQEGDFFIEYIIADGGSTDNSVEIIKKYERLLRNKEHPIKCKGIDFYWWSHKDKGQSDAINQGFKIAKGEILAWINSDDFYEPGAFAYIVRKFNENPDVDLIYGDSYMLKQNSGEKIRLKSKQGTFEELLSERYPIFQPSVFFTKKIIQKVGFLDENLHFPLDYDLWLRIFKKDKCLYFPQTLSTFRVWEKSKTSPQKEKELFSRKGLPQSTNTSEKVYTFEKHIKDREYLLEKYKKWFEKYPSAYAIHLRHIGTMNLLVGNKEKSKKYFLQCIKIKPSLRNILTFFLSLLGRRVYWSVLNIKRKMAGDVCWD